MVDVDALKASPIGRAVNILGPEPGGTEATIPYWAYVPDPLPPTPSLELSTLAVATDAAMAIARLDQALAQLPNPSLLLRPIIRREATSTSALEGTYAEFGEVLEADFLDPRQLSGEQREIQNFVRAVDHAVDQLRARPISRKLIGELQQIIVRGTPGETYDAGDLRQRQVYIGPKNRPVQEARFVPCPNGDALVEGFSDWEKWINDCEKVPLVVRLALGHYQFETLHPYADGNGRLGRLIAIMQLLEAKALSSPALNLSPWFEVRRQEYMDGLLRVSHTGDFDSWVRFFSAAVEAQAKDGVQVINELIAFKDATLVRLRKAGLRGSGLQIAENLIGYPVIDVSTARAMTGKTFEAANQAVARLVELGVLREITGRRMNRLFVCRPVFNIVNRPPAAASA
jgi:Fic family protein